MGFLFSQESLTTLEWILRVVCSFFFLLVTVKIMGQRSISQLRLLDFIIALVFGNIIAHPLSDPKLGLKGSFISIIGLVVLHNIGVFLCLKSKTVRGFLDPSPFPLIKDGQFIFKNLKKAKIPLDFVLLELRKNQVVDVQKVSLALWEADGTISFFLDPKNQAVTPMDMNLESKPFLFPRTIIKEGKIEFDVLREMKKDEMWLKMQIKRTFHTDIKDILLATIDDHGCVKVFFYK
ncbi:DUF421 domain-containing protein [Bacillus sp. V5-8f]|uniref:DUF421 domain-containing protein n=1 Tax=Bacillus sp. V5-8f TaxID=2053044 RepID=UPI000C76AD96|nr:DUF421 domain-containing protein [Bacillus sp. V5-8f]PLT32919.1 hypothetical protein CUU64_15890 [Bacillus sp. V5-8f]